jgi:Rab-GTPase-TBC domain
MLTSGIRRWIRLLFGREFPFDELLDLWDALLAEDPALDLVDMVCVAMLLRIRWQRKSVLPLTADSTDILCSDRRELLFRIDASTQVSSA